MLGRLRMTISEVEREYDIISKEVFGEQAHWAPTSFIFGTGKFSHETLQKEIQRVVTACSGNPDEKMLDDKNPCKVLVKLALPITARAKD